MSVCIEDALMHNTRAVDTLINRRIKNNGRANQYIAENSHPFGKQCSADNPKAHLIQGGLMV